jgi:hypothetical protein
MFLSPKILKMLHVKLRIITEGLVVVSGTLDSITLQHTQLVVLPVPHSRGFSVWEKGLSTGPFVI